MAKTKQSQRRAPAAKRDLPEIELEPDAWPRFEQFIKQVAKARPKHRDKAAPKPHTSAKKHAKHKG